MPTPTLEPYTDTAQREDPIGRISAEIAGSPDFRSLLLAKKRVIVGATLFFLAYYFALPVLSGYLPELMGKQVFGPFSLAYLFALSQFPMAWAVAAFYLRAASGFDRQAESILTRHRAPNREGAANS